MKKVLLLLVCLFTLQTVVWADDVKPIQVKDVYKRQQNGNTNRGSICISIKRLQIIGKLFLPFCIREVIALSHLLITSL